MSIKKCISCEYAVIQKNYDRITKCVIACRQHHDIFAPECEYNTSNTLNALDCVERQAAIDEMSKMYRAAEKWLQEAEDDTIKARAESCMASLVEMKLRVEKLPSAEPTAADCWGCKCPKMERLTERRGKWEKKWHSVFKQEIPCCSECRNFTAFRWDYCPNCGAKMITDEDDTQ